MPVILSTMFRWLASSLLFPLGQWLFKGIIIPALEKTVVAFYRSYKLKQLEKQIADTASHKVDAYDQATDKPTASSTFANLP